MLSLSVLLCDGIVSNRIFEKKGSDSLVNEQQRNYSIDFLKLLFTVVIVLHHSRLFRESLLRGYVAVEFFYFISGYFICLTFKKNITVGQFVKARLRKLFPGYLTAFILISIAFLAVNEYSYDAWYGPLLEALMLQSIGIPKSRGINYPLWYLSVLFYGGTLIYIMLRTIKKRWFNILGGIIVFLTYGFLIFHEQGVESWGTVAGIIHVPFWRGVSDLIIGVWICNISKPLANKFSRTCISINLLQLVSFIASITLLFLPGKLDFIAIASFAVLVYSSTIQGGVLDHLGRSALFRKCYPYQYYVFLNHALAVLVCSFIMKFIHLPVLLHVCLLFCLVGGLAFVTKKLSDFSIHLIESKVSQ